MAALRSFVQNSRQSHYGHGCRLFSSNKLQATTCFSGMLWLFFYIRAAMQWRETIMAVVVSRLEVLQTTASMPFPAPPSESIKEKLFSSLQPAFLYVSGSLFYLHWVQHVYVYSSPSFLSSPMRRKQASSVSETTKVKISYGSSLLSGSNLSWCSWLVVKSVQSSISLHKVGNFVCNDVMR